MLTSVTAFNTDALRLPQYGTSPHRRTRAFGAAPEDSKSFVSRVDAVGEGRARKTPGDVTSAAFVGSLDSTSDIITGIPSVRARRGSTGIAELGSAELEGPLQGHVASNSRTMPPPPSKAIDQQNASDSVENLRVNAASAIR